MQPRITNYQPGPYGINMILLVKTTVWLVVVLLMVAFLITVLGKAPD